MANQFLSLSLFLMLLSFFIVLNSVSDFEETKAVPAALNSLLLAFSNDVKNIEDKPSPAPSLYQDKRGGDTIEALEGVFNAHIGGFEAKRNRLGTVLHVQLPMQRFENAVNEATFENAGFGAGTLQSFMTTLVTVLRSAENGQPYRIDMVMNVSEDPVILSENAPDDFVTALKRVSDLATTLENKGIPKKMLSAGLVSGKAGMIDLYFYRYTPFTLDVKAQEDKDALPSSGNAGVKDL